LEHNAITMCKCPTSEHTAMTTRNRSSTLEQCSPVRRLLHDVETL